MLVSLFRYCYCNKSLEHFSDRIHITSYFLCHIYFSSLLGNTLYVNTNDSLKRPQTADTIRSNGTSHNEYSMFPYENTASVNKTPRRMKARDHKSASPVRVSTWKHLSSDDDG